MTQPAAVDEHVVAGGDENAYGSETAEAFSKTDLERLGRQRPECFATAWAEGRALSLEVAVDEALAATAGEDRGEDVHGLTRREVEVVRLLVAGHSNREIGDVLSISERTVEHHAAHIFGKFGVSSRSAAVAHAIRHGLT